MAAGSIIIDLLMRTGSFETDTDRAAKKFEKKLSDMEKAAVSAAKSIGVGFTAVAASIGGAFLGLEKAANLIADYQGLAEKIGDSAVAVAGLQKAADISGVSMDAVAAASVKLTSVLSKTDEESDKAAKALAALGLNLEEFKRLSPTQQLNEVAKGLAKFEDGAGKTAVAVALLGKSGAEMLPFLNDLNQYGAENSKLTKEQIEAADKFAKQLAEVKSQLSELLRVIVAEFIPGVSKFISILSDASKTTDSFIEGLLVATGGPNPFLNLQENIRGTQDEIDLLSEKLKELQSRGTEGDMLGLRAGSVARISEEIAVLTKRLAALKQAAQTKALAGVPSGPLDARDRPAVGALPSLNFSEADGGEAAKKKAADQEAALKKSLDARKKWWDEYVKNTVSGLKTIEDAEEEVAKQEGEAIERARLLAETLRQDGVAAYRAVMTPAEQYAETLANLKRLSDAGAISQETYDRSLIKAGKEFEDATKKAEKLNEVGDQLTMTFSSAFEDAVVGGKNMSDVMKGLGQDILRMTLRLAVVEPMMKNIKAAMNGFMSAGSSGGGGFNFGAAFASLLGGGGATGGMGSTNYINGGGSGLGMYTIPGQPSTGGIAAPKMSAQKGGGNTYQYNVAAGVSRSELMSALQVMAKTMSADTDKKIRMAG